MAKKYNGIFTVLLLLLPLAAVSFPEGQNSPVPLPLSKSEIAKRKLDPAVIETVFRDMLADKEHEIAEALTLDGQHPSIRLTSQSSGYSVYLDSDQLECYLEKGQCIPQNLQADIQQRNSQPVELAYLAKKSKIISLRSPELVTGHGREGLGQVGIALPGYSANNRQAVVRLSIAEGIHSAIVTYLLVRDKHGWKVEWRSILHLL